MPTVIAIIQLVLIAIAFGLCGYLFLSLKRELHGIEKRSKAEAQESASMVLALAREIADLRKDMETTLPQSLPVAANSITTNKRSQALKMVRMGDGPEHIAAVLSLPRKEVELLIKVQRMLVEPNGAATS